MLGSNAAGNKLLAVLRVGSCRFAAFYFLSFQLALLRAGQNGIRWIVFGFFFWLLHCLGVELLNRYSDRVEDRINRPDRSRICEGIGYQRIRDASIVIWTILALVYATWLFWQPSRMLGLLLWTGLFAGVCYSILWRFKTKRLLSLGALTFPFGGPFLIGWIAGNRFQTAEFLREDLVRLVPFLLMVGSFACGHAGIKDITDIAGDRAIGYRSLWVSWISLVSHRRMILVLFSVSTWASLTTVFVAFGLLPTRYRYLLLLLPVSAALGVASARASTVLERAAVRETLYYYWFGFNALAMFLLVPNAGSAGRVVLAVLYWIVASRYFHWTDGLTLEKLRTSLRLSIDGGNTQLTPIARNT
jgi:4-hydroxybenzoate polyprenyltransferase